MKSDFVYLRHILDAISRIEKYVMGIKYEDFVNSHLIQDGAIRQIEIIGEATKMLSGDIKRRHSGISWKDMAGMRDKLIHGYFGVDIDAVWDTIERDIPVLKSKLEDIVEKELI